MKSSFLLCFFGSLFSFFLTSFGRSFFLSVFLSLCFLFLSLSLTFLGLVGKLRRAGLRLCLSAALHFFFHPRPSSLSLSDLHQYKGTRDQQHHWFVSSEVFGWSGAPPHSEICDLAEFHDQHQAKHPLLAHKPSTLPGSDRQQENDPTAWRRLAWQASGNAGKVCKKIASSRYCFAAWVKGTDQGRACRILPRTPHIKELATDVTALPAVVLKACLGVVRALSPEPCRIWAPPRRSQTQSGNGRSLPECGRSRVTVWGMDWC